MQFLHVWILAGSLGATFASAEVISWDAVRAHKMVRQALGEVPTDVRPALRRVSTPIQVQALLLMLGHLDCGITETVELCLAFKTDEQITELARLILCNRALGRERGLR